MQSPNHNIVQTERGNHFFPSVFNFSPFVSTFILPPPSWLQKLSLSVGMHSISCSMSKPIVQLRELFQYIAGSQ